jgi:hypothetical protein
MVELAPLEMLLGMLAVVLEECFAYWEGLHHHPDQIVGLVAVPDVAVVAVVAEEQPVEGVVAEVGSVRKLQPAGVRWHWVDLADVGGLLRG